MVYSTNSISQYFATPIASDATPRTISEVVTRTFNLADEHFSQLLIPDHAQLTNEQLGERVWSIWQWLKKEGTAEMGHKLLRCYWQTGVVILEREQNISQLRPDFADQLFALRSASFSMQMLLDLLTISPKKEIVPLFNHRLRIHFRESNPLPLLEPYFCKLYQLQWTDALILLMDVVPSLTWEVWILALAFRYVDDETVSLLLGQLPEMDPQRFYNALHGHELPAPVLLRIDRHPFFSQCVRFTLPGLI